MHDEGGSHDQKDIWLDRRGLGDSALEREESTLHGLVGGEHAPLLLELIPRVVVVLVEEGILEAGATLTLVAALVELVALTLHTNRAVKVAAVRVFERVRLVIRHVALVNVQIAQFHVNSHHTSFFGMQNCQIQSNFQVFHPQMTHLNSRPVPN